MMSLFSPQLKIPGSAMPFVPKHNSAYKKFHKIYHSQVLTEKIVHEYLQRWKSMQEIEDTICGFVYNYYPLKWSIFTADIFLSYELLTINSKNKIINIIF